MECHTVRDAPDIGAARQIGAPTPGRGRMRRGPGSLEAEAVAFPHAVLSKCALKREQTLEMVQVFFARVERDKEWLVQAQHTAGSPLNY